MAACSGEKSEGEITSDSGEEEERPPDRPPSPKRVKNTEDAREWGWQESTGMLAKRREEKKKHKNKKRRLRKQKQRVKRCKGSLWNSSVPVSVDRSLFANQFLDSDQTLILMQLVSLLRPPSPPLNPAPSPSPRPAPSLTPEVTVPSLTSEATYPTPSLTPKATNPAPSLTPEATVPSLTSDATYPTPSLTPEATNPAPSPTSETTAPVPCPTTKVTNSLPSITPVATRSAPSQVTNPSSLAPETTGSDPQHKANELKTFKTAKLQGVILHLLLGVPWLESPIDGLEELRSHRVAIVWLSMVSAKLFLSSSELFSGLKALSPCVQFLVEHPGSSRYVKLGLESLMFITEKEEEGKQGHRGSKWKRLFKADCLLSAVDMERNNFPVPPPLQKEPSKEQEECSSYFKLCEEWPDDVSDMQAANGYPMLALDCEMVETKEGLELARVSVVNEDLQCVYDKLVKPENPVLDYKTQYSGINEETLRNISTTLSDVQRDLTELLLLRCILIGHSLENDLHALKMFHPYVIDTSCLFLPAPNSLNKPKLRFLAKKLLGADIQTGDNGHCSVEDATTCMKLVLRRLRDGEKTTIAWKGRSILTEVASLGRSVATVDRPGNVNLFGPHTSKYSVTSDKQAVMVAKEAITDHDLTFLQLHGYEDHLKTLDTSGESWTSVLSRLDSQVMDIVSSCPSGTVVIVVCGSSDIREVRWLQQKQYLELLPEVVAVARTGLACAYIVR